MWRTNLKILLTVVVTLGVYTGVANVIPQVESEVPEAVEVSADVSTSELVSLGEEIYHGPGGCEACHALGTRAPKLVGEIGTRCGRRKEGVGCKQYLYESLTDPGAFVVDGFQPIMPDMERQLTAPQIWAVVAFLQSQGGEVTVRSEDLAASGQGGGDTAAGSGQEAAASPGGDAPRGAGGAGGGKAGGAGATAPGAVFRQYGCLACHKHQGQGGVTAPPFDSIRAAARPASYVRRSILEPGADTAAGWEQFAGTMPPNFGQQMTAAELEALVDYLSGDRR